LVSDPNAAARAAERHDVTAGPGHFCVVTPAEAVDGTKTDVPASVTFMAVTAGDAFTCGLTAR